MSNLSATPLGPGTRKGQTIYRIEDGRGNWLGDFYGSTPQDAMRFLIAIGARQEEEGIYA